MWLLALEAGVAFGLFIFIVWWTMFSGRKPEQIEQKTNANSTSEETQDANAAAKSEPME